MREVIGCTVFGCILGLVVRPQQARVYTPDGLSREEVVTIIVAIVTSVALTFGVYLWLVRRDRN